MNLCHPDDRKSCAACCGLYNVPDATRLELLARLTERTLIFQDVERTPDAIQEFEVRVRAGKADQPLDQIIHVCGFTGFVDRAFRCVGCMLHPMAPGNNDIDFRGLCHYGSMACKTFYCPAWEDVPQPYLSAVCDVIDDWHLYGLVVTDVSFVLSLFDLLQEKLGEPLDPIILSRGRVRVVLHQMLSWKNFWPFSGPSVIRRSPYFVNKRTAFSEALTSQHASRLVNALRFTYGFENEVEGPYELVRQTTAQFICAYRKELVSCKLSS